MVDLAPTGHISLRDYYDRFVAWLWNGEDPFERLKIEERIAGLPFERVAMHQANRARVTDTCMAEAITPSGAAGYRHSSSIQGIESAGICRIGPGGPPSSQSG
jgi:hypothetical protein